ncbi:hypothetical protein [Natronorubrum halophilum]|uniref:hypothetical protein n=1 Tax=Natronorubrum halophilum TaxID=1702106 RepID=UPI000EF65A19|nr:hypothetical protein [Natronorubrum halophilum]
MSPSTNTVTRAFPTRAIYDHAADRLTVAADLFPDDVDDITVTVSPREIRLLVDRDETTLERSVAPPAPRRVFTDDREAVYNNGILTVSVGTARRPRRSGLVE